MTDTKEVVAYVLAHLAGYVVGFVVNTLVMVPLFRESGLAGSYAGMLAMSFLVYLLIQVVVFFLFILIRNRRSQGG